MKGSENEEFGAGKASLARKANGEEMWKTRGRLQVRSLE